MKLNKKGMSLAELIIAVGLISIVIVFLYSLLSDLKNEITNSDFALNNQLTRYEIIKTVQNDMLGEQIKEIKTDNSNFEIEITYENGTSTYIKIDSEEGSFVVIEKDDTITKWVVDENCFIGDFDDIDIKNGGIEGDVTFYINIPIYTTNAENISLNNNNFLDDLTFYFVND